jgi:hypothetical protein
MTLKTQIASDMGAIFNNTDEFAESMLYNPSSILISSFLFEGIWEDGEIDQMGSNVFRDSGKVRILDVDLTAMGITEPVPVRQNQVGDTITRLGVVWTVVDPIEHDTQCGQFTVAVEKDLRFAAR